MKNTTIRWMAGAVVALASMSAQAAISPAATIDATTRGTAWTNAYGKAGYILFAFDNTSGDRTSIPSYITGYSVGNSITRFRGWGAPTADVRALQDPTNSSVRNATIIYAANTTISAPYKVTINPSQTRRFKLGIYWLDWDGGRVSDLTINGTGLTGTDNLSKGSYANGLWYTYMVAATNGTPIELCPVYENVSGSYNWAICAVTFDPVEPSIANGVAQNIQLHSANVVGTLTSTGAAPATAYLYWATNDCGTNAAAWIGGGGVANLGPYVQGAIFTNTLNGLASNTVYYYNHLASNTYGTAWAATNNSPFLRTLGAAPAVDNGGGATNIGPYTATLRGTLTDGGSAHIFVYWGTDSGSWSHTNDLSVLGQVPFQQGIDTLLPLTTYYYRCYATNDYGASQSAVTNFRTIWTSNTWYVATNGTGAGHEPGAPTNSLQGAINQCAVSGTVWVADGVYGSGGVTNYPTGSTLTNRIAIWKAITVSSTNSDPAATVIVGARDANTNGPTAVRGVYMAAGARLTGFTVTNAATFAYAWSGGGGTVGNQCGGGVLCADNSAVISHCVIAGNTAGGFYNTYGGGGVYLGSLFGCVIVGNESYCGGGAQSSILSNCTLTANAALAGGLYPLGGGAYLSTLYNCILAGNQVGVGTGVTGAGGGASACTLYSCVLTNNTAVWPDNGGGVFGGTLYACTLTDNSAARGGGADSATLYNCLLIRNVSVSGYGGGAELSALFNCAIVSNRLSANSNGGGLYNCSAVTNCIVYFNIDGAGAVNNCDTIASNAVGNSCMTPAIAGWAVGNITNNPQFVNAANGDYHLAKGSKCINAGTYLSWMDTPSDPRSKDRDGQPRIKDGAVDMGAYEYLLSSRGAAVFFR